MTDPETDPEIEAVPSDRDPAIAAHGDGDVVASVVSMSERHPEGRDAEYLAWHVLDHLPEQYRLAGLRHGQRWVSTPECRAARIVSEPPFDAVDHIVQYLFAEPVDPALDQFFPLGGALRERGRMPMVLPRVQVGGWTLERTVAADRVLVGASVLPWRPVTGAIVVIERRGTGVDADRSADRDLLEVPGVAGLWSWSGAAPRHARLESTEGLDLTIAYLDGDPVEVAAAFRAPLTARWTRASSTPLLAAPFEPVVAWAWDRSLPDPGAGAARR